MTPQDMAALHARCFTHPRPWSAAEFEALLCDPLCHLDLAPHGFILGRSIADEAELLTLAVAPEVRRRGTGRQLLHRFEQAARARGAAMAFLEVAAQNTPALGLYRAHGYVQVGRRPGYYAGLDALVLRKDLETITKV